MYKYCHAVEPRIALELLTKTYADAKAEALNQFRLLESRSIPRHVEEPIWSLFGSKSLEFKIMDMLKNARKSIYCQMSGKYLDYFEKTVKRNVSMYLFLTANKPEMTDRLNNLSKSGNVHLKIADIDGLEAMSAHVRTSPDDSHKTLTNLPPDLQAQLAEMADPDNLLMLVVDDAETLFVQPLKSDTIMATWTTNRGMVLLTKFSIEAMFKATIPEPPENCKI